MRKESLLLYWILIVFSFWVCFICPVTAMDSSSKALEFLGVLEDEHNQANTEPRKLVDSLDLRRRFGVDQGV
jgi:hypothetical protein